MKIKLNDKWTIKTAKELYTYTSGISKGSQFFGTGYPYLTFTEFFHNYFVPDELTSLVQSNDRERENCSIKRGDVFLTRTSETDDELGMSCVALKDYPNATFNGFTKRLRPLTDEVVPEYAGFYFRSPIFRAAVTSMSSIITRASLNEKMLDKLPICYPSKPTQQKIASILSAYDNLIQNYKKQIEALQTAASELYKEWFVRFRFPGWQNANFENGIPEGWKIEKVKNCVNRLPFGQTYKKDELEPEGNVIVIDQSEDECLGYHNNEPSHKASAENPIALFGDHSCKYKLMIKDFSLGENIIPYTSKGVDLYYLYYSVYKIVQTEEYKRHWNLFVNKKVLIPNTELQKSFRKKVIPIFKQIEMLYKQITNLTQQRDLLLPRLMSGKLEME